MLKNKNIIDLVIFLALTTIIFFSWNTVFIYPLKLLVVFFHESSHALAVLVTGGDVKEMEIVAQAGGHVVSVGGNRFFTLTAGYLGSLLWGMVIFIIAVSSNFDRWLMAFLGLVLIVITVVYGSNSFVMIFGISMGVILLASAKFLSVAINDLLLRLIGVTSMLYVPLDIYSDTIERSHLKSDAFMLAEEFGGSAVMWGWLWLIVSITLIIVCLRWFVIKQANTLSTETKY